MIRRLLSWLFPPSDVVSDSTLRRIQAAEDAAALLPPIRTADAWPKPPEERKEPAPSHRAYTEEGIAR